MRAAALLDIFLPAHRVTLSLQVWASTRQCDFTRNLSDCIAVIEHRALLVHPVQCPGCHGKRMPFAVAALCRIQAALGNYMAWLVPKAQMVPAVDPDNLHPDKAVVSSNSKRSSHN